MAIRSTGQSDKPADSTHLAVRRSSRSDAHRLVLEIEAPAEEHDRLLRLTRSVISHQRSLSVVSQAFREVESLPGAATLAALRDLEIAWAEVDRRYGLLTPGEAARRAGSRTRNAAQWLTDKVRAGSMLAPKRGAHRVVPGFQLGGSGPRPEVAAPLAVFRAAGWRDSSILFWFTSPNARLGGVDPVAALVGDPGRVVAAAKEAVQPW